MREVCCSVGRKISEREEGEIGNNDIEDDQVVNYEFVRDDDGQDDSGGCLNLFPLRMEDMKFRCRAGVGDEVDLDLGLRPPSSADARSGSAVIF